MEAAGSQQLFLCPVLFGLLGFFFGIVFHFLVSKPAAVLSACTERHGETRQSQPKSRFFFDKVVSDGASSTVWLMAIAINGGRTIEAALKSTEVLKAQLRTNRISYSDDGNGSLAAEIDFGGNTWDKRVMRVRFKVRLMMPADVARSSLIDAGFVEGFRESLC